MPALNTYLVIKQRRKRQTRGARTLAHRSGRFFTGLGGILILFLAVAAVMLTLAYGWLARDLPSPAALPAQLDSGSGPFFTPTRVLDRSGKTVLLALDYPTAPRRYVTLNRARPEHLPPDLVLAVVAVMDPNFWGHPGFLLTAPLDAPPATLAERLASDFLLTDEPPSLARSLRLRLLAAQLTAQYGQEKIIEFYLNSAYFGRLAYGADQAAQLYLGKPASQLNLAECALLAAVVQAPSLNPLDAPEAARQRQQQVLDSLLSSGAISKERAVEARLVDLSFRPAPPPADNPARAFTTLVVDQLSAVLGRSRLERGGLVVRTTLDLDLQRQTACTIQMRLASLAGSTAEVSGDPGSPGGDCQAGRLLPGLPSTSDGASLQIPDARASAVILDPQNGQVLALVGDSTLAQGESSSLSAHPAGSLLTPFIYLTGFARGLGPATLVWDIPASLPTTAAGYANPDGKFHGPVRLRLAMANDYLAPAAQLLAQIGPENVWGLAQPFGLPYLSGDPLPYDGGRLTPVQLAQAYGVFANGGVLAGRAVNDGQTGSSAGAPLVSSLVLDVKGVDGRTWLDWTQPASRPILSASLVYLLNHVLSDETARWPSLGSANALEIGRPVAAKLGQTASGQDAWAAGYTAGRVVVVWMGGDSVQVGVQTSLPASSANLPARLDPRLPAGLWRALILHATRDLPVEGWTAPAGINTVEVCDPSGLLPTSACPNIVSEVFLAGSEPTSGDTLYRTFQVNRETGRLATVFTPLSMIEEHTYLVAPPEARQWAQATGLAVPPESYDTIQAPTLLPDAHFTSPALFVSVSGEVPLTGSAGGSGFVSYSLQAGQGLNPPAWIQIGSEQTSPVAEGLLQTWDTRQQPDGLYAVRLVVLHQDQRVETAILQVTIDNTPPEVAVIYPTDRQTIASSTVFQVKASDSLELVRVEWWVDGKLAGSLVQGPFSLPWQGAAGTHTLVVKAFDRAGNQSETPPVEFTVE